MWFLRLSVILCFRVVTAQAQIMSHNEGIATEPSLMTAPDGATDITGVSAIAPNPREHLRTEFDTTTYYFETQTEKFIPEMKEDFSPDRLFLKRHQCGFIDSCFGRCGSGPSDSDSIFSYLINGQNPSSLRTSYACFCDSLCSDYGDCCRDFNRYCQSVIMGQKTETDYGHDIFIDFPGSSSEKLDQEYALSDDSKKINKENTLYECTHLNEIEHGSIWLRAECHSEWENSHVQFMCRNMNYNDDISVLLVQGEDGKTYRNIFCAECNHLNTFRYWILDSYCYGELPESLSEKPEVLSMYLLTKCVTRYRVPFGQRYRPCLKIRDTCFNDSRYTSLKEQCEGGHQSLVTSETTSAEGWGSIIYHNPFCAQCNGVDSDSISCPTKEVLQENFLNNATKTKAFLKTVMGRNDMEASCRIVTNYNIANSYSNTVIYEEDGSVIPVVVRCDEGMVFDPYLGKCRQLHCSHGYVLVGQKCVPTGATSPLDEDDIIEIQNAVESLINETLVLAEEIVITIKFMIELDLSNKNKGDSRVPPFEIPPQTSPVMNKIDWDIYINSLLKNTTPNGESGCNLYEITLTLVIKDPSAFNRNSPGKIVHLIEILVNLYGAQELHVCMNSLCLQPNEEGFKLMMEVTDGNMTDLNYLLSRCKTGNITMLASSEFSIYNEGNSSVALDCPTLYVNSTEDVYGCTDTYIFGYDPAQPTEGQSFGALICESASPLDPTCELLFLNETEYEMLRNGTIIVHDSIIYDVDEYYITPQGVEVCNLHSNVISVTMVVFFDFSDTQKIVLYIGLLISTACLTLTLFTYTIFSELRTLPGLHRMSLMVASVGGNITMMMAISLNPGSMMCQVTAMMMHLLFLVRIFWTNAILIHSFHTFGSKIHKRINQSLQVLRTNRPRSRFRQHAAYSLYAWGAPMIFIALGGVWHFCACGSLPVYYGTYFSCWIADPATFLYLFVLPLLVLLIANALLYILTVYSIQQTTEKSPRKSIDKEKMRPRVKIYIKLSTTAGFCWMFAILAVFTAVNFFWYPFIIFMSLEGLFMFFSFFCTKRTKALYSRRFGSKFFKSVQRCKSEGTVYAVSGTMEKKTSENPVENCMNIDV